MRISIQDRPPATIAYFRHVGPYGNAIEQFWQEVYVPWAIANKLGPQHARFGISHDDPHFTQPGQCRYDACAEVSPDFVATGGAQIGTLPGGKFSVLPFNGTVEQLSDAWTALLFNWLPSSGYRLDKRPIFEYYPQGARYDAESGEFACELCLPVTNARTA